MHEVFVVSRLLLVVVEQAESMMGPVVHVRVGQQSGRKLREAAGQRMASDSRPEVSCLSFAGLFCVGSGCECLGNSPRGGGATSKSSAAWDCLPQPFFLRAELSCGGADSLHLL